MDGDEGWDTVDYSDRSEAIKVSLDGLANDGWSAGGPVPLTEGDNVTETVEEVHGTSAGDRLIAGAGQERACRAQRAPTASRAARGST